MMTSSNERPCSRYVPRAHWIGPLALVMTFQLACAGDAHDGSEGAIDAPTPGGAQDEQTGASDGADELAVARLPGGKARWSFGVGVFSSGKVAQSRLVNMTFRNGTVSAVIWSWRATDQTTHGIFDAGHTCNVDSTSRTCPVYSAFGFPSPASQYTTWSGTFTYHAGVLSIRWSSGATEVWSITNPVSDMAMATLDGNSYGLTHGRGYGSNASWTYRVRASDYPKKSYPGKYVGKAVDSTGAQTSLVTDWQPFSINLAALQWKSSSDPNVIHADFPTTACTGACATNRSGLRYHFATNEANRQATYNHFCKCLASDATYPCYSGNSHTYSLMNLVGDTGTFHGWVGVEAQNMPGASKSYKVVAMDDI